MEAAVRAITRMNPEALQAVADMAATYALPHNVLGTHAARPYVMRLAEHPLGRWYGVFSGDVLRVAAHLALYGQGDGRSHSLWKIRHPLAVMGDAPLSLWVRLFDGLVQEALRVRPGSVKVVLFLSEHEREVGYAAERADFAVEGRLRDFYRLEELCLIYGRTASSQVHSRAYTGTRTG